MDACILLMSFHRQWENQDDTSTEQIFKEKQSQDNDKEVDDAASGDSGEEDDPDGEDVEEKIEDAEEKMQDAQEKQVEDDEDEEDADAEEDAESGPQKTGLTM